MQRVIYTLALVVIIAVVGMSADASAEYVCGDANGDGSLNVGDAVFMINHVFKGGPTPEPDCCAECQSGETRPCYTGPPGTEEVGQCSAGTQTCVEGAWGPCEGETLPGTEDCDGLDNDCDGVEDNNLTPPPCELTQGVCAGAFRTCDGPDGWLPCSGSDYGPNYEPTETTCDGLDNDCDGIVDEGCCPPTVTDYDGNVYPVVKIGDQCWMMENLKVTHYRNGDPIPNIIDNGEWQGLTTGAYCNYNNDEGNVATYGRLYNWYAVDDSRNIAPEGWRVPTDAEWKQLEMYLGMSQAEADAEGWRGTDEGGKLKEAGTTHWLSPNTGATNESGFSALPGGLRNESGYFDDMGGYAYFWSSTETNSYSAWSRYLSYYGSQVCRYNYYKRDGFSVRCVRD